MTDCAEEQEMEVEALLSILMDDMAVVTGSEAIAGATHAPCYQIVVSPLGDGEEEDPDGDESQRARLGLVFSHTPNYPEEPPLIKCRSLRGSSTPSSRRASRCSTRWRKNRSACR